MTGKTSDKFSEAAMMLNTYETEMEDLNPQWLRIRNTELERSNQLLTSEITDLRRIERTLQSENLTLVELNRAGTLGILLATAEGILIEANDAFLKMIGYSREYTAEEKICWKQICTTNEVLTMCERDGNYVPRETQFIRKDGTHIGLVFGAHRTASRAVQIVGFAVLVNQPRGKEIRSSVQEHMAQNDFFINGVKRPGPPQLLDNSNQENR